MKIFIPLMLLSLLSVSCIKIDQFEKTAQISSGKWFYPNAPTFTFHITDTTALYNIYIVLRHTDAYDYNNIWLRLGTQFPGDSMQFKNINLTLENDVKGWEGTGMGDIFEVRKNISRGQVLFKKAGEYTFSIAQVMRESPLEDILSVGIRIEKSGL